MLTKIDPTAKAVDQTIIPAINGTGIPVNLDALPKASNPPTKALDSRMYKTSANPNGYTKRNSTDNTPTACLYR